MDRVRLPAIDPVHPLGAANYGLFQPLQTPSMENLLPQRYQTQPQPQQGTAADRFIARYSQQFDQGMGDMFGMGQAGSQFTNVGALAGGALADAQGFINASAARNGIPANLLAAIIARESTGNWARDGGRYVYLADRGHSILPYVGMTDPAIRRVGMDPRSLVGNQAGQIEAAARLIRAIADNEAKGYGWQGVANVYYSGDPTGRSTPSDSYQYGTTQQYGNDILNFWERLAPGESSMASKITNAAKGVGDALSMIWGGAMKPLTQEMGLTDFARGEGAWMYGYSNSVGVQGHAGLDYGMNPGETLRSPVSGTVIIAGGSGYYKDDRLGNAPGTGELRIKLDNGDELILGHMQQISVRVGQRVNPGDFVGLSGYAGTGGHVHIEYRTPTPGKTSSGYTALDPRQALGNQNFLGMTGKVSSPFAQSGMQTFAQNLSRGIGTALSSLFKW